MSSSAASSTTPQPGRTGDQTRIEFIRSSFVDDVVFFRRFHNFPGSDKTSRNDETLTCTHRNRIAFAVSDDAFPLQYLAVFLFGVMDVPLAHFALPDSSEKFPRCVGIVFPQPLLRITRNELLRRQFVLLDNGFGSVEFQQPVHGFTRRSVCASECAARAVV